MIQYSRAQIPHMKTRLPRGINFPLILPQSLRLILRSQSLVARFLIYRGTAFALGGILVVHVSGEGLEGVDLLEDDEVAFVAAFDGEESFAATEGIHCALLWKCAT